jgi:hypothetical protein
MTDLEIMREMLTRARMKYSERRQRAASGQDFIDLDVEGNEGNFVGEFSFRLDGTLAEFNAFRT